MNPFYKNLSLWIVITLMFVMLYQIFSEQRLAETPVSYSEFLAMVADERVDEVVIQGQELMVKDTQGDRFKVYAPEDPDPDFDLEGQRHSYRRQTAGRVALVYVGAGILVPHADPDRGLGLFHAADAVRRRQGHELWQKPRAVEFGPVRQGHL